MEKKNNNSSKMFAFIMLWVPIVAYWKWLLMSSTFSKEGFVGMSILGLVICAIPFMSLYALDDILD